MVAVQLLQTGHDDGASGRAVHVTDNAKDKGHTDYEYNESADLTPRRIAVAGKYSRSGAE